MADNLAFTVNKFRM